MAPLLPYTSETLLMDEASSCAEGEEGWRFTFVRVTGGVFTEEWAKTVCWTPPSPIPIDPNTASSCSQVELSLPQTAGGGSTSVLLEAAYPDACDHDDYPAKVQSPWHNDIPR